MPVEFTIEQKSLQDLSRRLMAEADGKKLRRDLGKELKRAAIPIVTHAKSNVMSMPSSGGGAAGAPLRATIARQVKTQVRWSGRSTGVRIRVGRSKMPRGFKNAPKRLNSARGWRHPVFGDTDRWVTQQGRPSWFHEATRGHRTEVRKAIQRAMKAAADRVARGR